MMTKRPNKTRKTKATTIGVDGWRREIDRLDAQLLRLLSRRARLAGRIGAVKYREKAPIRDPKREKAILDRLEAANPGPLSERGVRSIYRQIILACCEVQRAIHRQRGR